MENKPKCPKCKADIEKLFVNEKVIRESVYDLDDGFYDESYEDMDEKAYYFCPECNEKLCEDFAEAERILSGLTRLQEVVKDKIAKDKRKEIIKVRYNINGGKENVS